MKQFEANLGIMSKEGHDRISRKHVLVIGLGGLGGYIASSLARLGVLNLTLIDYDRFDESNLNRQLFSNHETIGLFKGDVVKEELLKINPSINVTVIKKDINTVNLNDLSSIDMVMDAVDKIHTKLYIETLASSLNVPLIHGAIGGWFGQLGVILPHSNLLKKLYGEIFEGVEKTLKNPTFTPAVFGNMMVSETVKVFLNHEDTLWNKIISIDLLTYHKHVLIEGDVK